MALGGLAVLPESSFRCTTLAQMPGGGSAGAAPMSRSGLRPSDLVGEAHPFSDPPCVGPRDVGEVLSLQIGHGIQDLNALHAPSFWSHARRCRDRLLDGLQHGVWPQVHVVFPHSHGYPPAKAASSCPRGKDGRIPSHYPGESCSCSVPSTATPAIGRHAELQGCAPPGPELRPGRGRLRDARRSCRAPRLLVIWWCSGSLNMVRSAARKKASDLRRRYSSARPGG